MTRADIRRADHDKRARRRGEAIAAHAEVDPIHPGDLLRIRGLADLIASKVTLAAEFAADCTGLHGAGLSGAHLVTWQLSCGRIKCRCSHEAWLRRIALDLAAVLDLDLDGPGIWWARAPKVSNGYGQLIDGYGLPTDRPGERVLIVDQDPTGRRGRLGSLDWAHVAPVDAPDALAALLTELAPIAAMGGLSTDVTEGANTESGRHSSGRRPEPYGPRPRARVKFLRAMAEADRVTRAEQRAPLRFLGLTDIYRVADAARIAEATEGGQVGWWDKGDRCELHAPAHRVDDMLAALDVADTVTVDTPDGVSIEYRVTELVEARLAEQAAARDLAAELALAELDRRAGGMFATVRIDPDAGYRLDPEDLAAAGWDDAPDSQDGGNLEVEDGWPWSGPWQYDPDPPAG